MAGLYSPEIAGSVFGQDPRSVDFGLSAREAWPASSQKGRGLTGRWSMAAMGIMTAIHLRVS